MSKKRVTKMHRTAKYFVAMRIAWHFSVCDSSITLKPITQCKRFHYAKINLTIRQHFTGQKY